MFTRAVSVAIAIYTVFAFVVMSWARYIALPTNGGISASEVVEGVIPGGLNTLLLGWVLLTFMIVGARVWELSQK